MLVASSRARISKKGTVALCYRVAVQRRRKKSAGRPLGRSQRDDTARRGLDFSGAISGARSARRLPGLAGKAAVSLADVPMTLAPSVSGHFLIHYAISR
jgi:hypothetical protein